MSSRKIDDYKIYAVKSHLENESSFVNTCKCKKIDSKYTTGVYSIITRLPHSKMTTASNTGIHFMKLCDWFPIDKLDWSRLSQK